MQKKEEFETQIFGSKYKTKELSIDALGLGYRARRCINDIGVKTIEDFMALSQEDVISVWHVGIGTWQEIYEKQQTLAGFET